MSEDGNVDGEQSSERYYVYALHPGEEVQGKSDIQVDRPSANREALSKKIGCLNPKFVAVRLFYHTVVVAGVLEGLFAFVELLAEVHLPSETKDHHVAVVGGVMHVLVGMHLTESDGFIAETLGIEWAQPHQHGSETTPPVLYIEGLGHLVERIVFAAEIPVWQQSEVGSSHKALQ